MRRRKNRFLLFCCSMMPGAGEMYLGFMKMGVGIMAAFFLGLAVTGFSGIGVMSFIPIIVWFYSFFHANNLGALSNEELNSIEDNYLFIDMGDTGSVKAFVSGKYRKVFAVVLIIIGISMLGEVVSDVLYNIMGSEMYNKFFAEILYMFRFNIPRLIIGFGIIWIGVRLIQGKKAELNKSDNENVISQENVTAPEDKNEE